MTWQEIETAKAPESGQWGDVPRVLLFGNCGVQMGHIYVYPDGHRTARAEGHHGEWNITHWMPLPDGPS